jgi:hypothetical protein
LMKKQQAQLRDLRILMSWVFQGHGVLSSKFLTLSVRKFPSLISINKNNLYSTILRPKTSKY